MHMFSNLLAAQAFVKNLPGYVPPLVYTGDGSTDTIDNGNGTTTLKRSEVWIYNQEIGSSNSYKTRKCIILVTTNIESSGEATVASVGLSLEVASETPEGHLKVVNSYSGPDEYYPWVFSIWGHMARDGSDATKVRADGSAWQTGDADADCYFRKSFTNVLTYELGFQNIVACWARFNEGDTCDVFVDIPGSWAAAQAQANGADAGTVAYLNSLPWYQFVQFGEDITLFDSNSRGTHYPPTQSPAVSWLPAGSRIRFDVYKKVIDDPWFALTAGQTELTNPEKKGPFLDLDILGQRRR